MVDARGCLAAFVPGLGGRICPVSKALNRKGTSDLAYWAPPSTLHAKAVRLSHSKSARPKACASHQGPA